MPRKTILFISILLALIAASFIFWSAGVQHAGSPDLTLPIAFTATPLTRVETLPPTPTPSPYPSPTEPLFTVTPSPQPTLPAQHYITQITGHRQFFHLGCEASAAKDWSNYFHKDFNEFEFQYKLPISDNPDIGFVGDVNAPWGQVPPYGYGVYAGPVADLLNTYQIPARAAKGFTLEELKANIAQDKPVITWVIGNVVGGIPSVYTDKHGNKTIVAAYEHVVIVTGYNQDHIRYMTNGRFFETPTKVFLNSWGVLGNMVVVASN